MSETVKTNAYSEVLAPAVIAGTERLAALEISPDTHFMDKAQAFATETLHALEAVEWDNSGLPLGEALRGGETVPMQPREFAEYLTVQAFEDAIVLMELAAKIIRPKTSRASWIMSRLTGKRPQTDETAQVDIREVFTDSKQTLLNKVLGLSGGSKDLLYRAVRNPSQSRILLGFRFGELTPPIQLSEVEGKSKLVWSDQIEQWFKEHYEPGRGCPARNFVIDTPHGKQPVTHYLWDQLVALRFPEQQTQVDTFATIGSIATQAA